MDIDFQFHLIDIWTLIKYTYPLPLQPSLSSTSRLRRPSRTFFISGDIDSGNSTFYKENEKYFNFLTVHFCKSTEILKIDRQISMMIFMILSYVREAGSPLSHWCPQHIFGFEPQCPEGFAQNGYIRSTSTRGRQRVNEIFYFSLTLI